MKNLILLLSLGLFALTSCKKDECKGVTCLNGGNCANGTCLCPTGYTGSDCSQRVVPSSITITKITVNDFPIVDASGGSWDFDNGADIYVSLTQGGIEIANNVASTQLNALFTPVSWSTNGFIMFKSPEQFCLTLFDRDDFDADDFIGGVCFNPFDENTEGFPETINLSCQGCTVAFTLTVDYDF